MDVQTAQATTTTYVAYLHPGILLSEESVNKVGSRDPEQAAKDAPDSAFAFFYYDVITTVVDMGGEPVKTASNRRNISNTYYIDGEVLDYNSVDALPGDHNILLRSMRNGYDKVVRCRTDNFQPFNPNKHELVSTS